MSTTSMFPLLDGIVLIFGAYMTFQVVRMMMSGQMQDGSVFLTKDKPVSKCKDPAGYIRFMGPRQLILGILAILSGAMGLIQDYTSYISTPVYLGSTVVLVVYIIYYCVTASKANKTFWD